MSENIPAVPGSLPAFSVNRFSRLLSRIQQNNPFYIISAACMLAGCLAMTNSLSWTSIALGRLLALIATLNIYEAALIALAVCLVRRNLIRDGVMLLVLEAFFLVDISFLNAEIVTRDLSVGIPIDIVLFILALIKLAVVARALGHKSLDGRFGAIALQIAALFAIPMILRWNDHGWLSARAFYGAWWAVGLVIPLSFAISRHRAALRESWARKTAMLYMTLPWLSVVSHVGILHYVYGVTFFGADLGPALLGLAFVMRLASPTMFASRRELATLSFMLPLAALLVSLNDPGPLCFGLGKPATLWMTPTKLVVVAAYLTYVFCFAWPYARYFITGGLIVALAWMFGPSTQQIVNFFSRGWDWTLRTTWRLSPKTTEDWGITAILGAFGFLGVGAAISLRRQPAPPTPPPDIDASQANPGAA